MTRLHSERVADIARDLARKVKDGNEAYAQAIYRAARLHDIGKIAIPEAVLLKPGSLTPEEFALIQSHTTKGAELLSPARKVAFDQLVYNVILHHHERWDGRGYPKRLAGHEIPEEARIVGLADAYEAMTAGRPYRKAKTPEEALRRSRSFPATSLTPGWWKPSPSFGRRTPSGATATPIWRQRRDRYHALPSRSPLRPRPRPRPRSPAQGPRRNRAQGGLGLLSGRPLGRGLAYGTYRGLFAPEVAGPLAKLLVLLLVGYGLYQNRHLKSLYLVLLGLLLNALVIFANGGHMPVSPTALHRAGIGEFADLLRDKGDAVHALLDEKTRLPFLGDVIPLPPLRKVVSPGDLFILLGIVGVVVEGALKGGVRLRRRALALRLLLYLAFVLALLALRG